VDVAVHPWREDHSGHEDTAVSGPGILRQAWPGIILGAAIAIAALGAPGRLADAVAWNDANRGNDFGLLFDSATCFFVRSCAPYDLGRRAPNLNPPHTHLLLAPLVRTSQPVAYRVWLGLGALSVAAALVRLAAGPLSLSAGVWVLLVVGIVSSALTTATVRSGQIYPLFAWPMAEAYLAARSGRWRREAAIVAILATMKPLLLLPLAWICWRQRRAVWVAAGSIAAVMTAGVTLFGIAAYFDWRRSLASFAHSGHWWDGSILQSLTRTLDLTRSFEPAVFAPDVVLPLWLLFSALLLLNLRRWIPLTSTDAGWVGVIVVAMLIAPKGWLYMGWWLLPPVLGLVRAGGWTLPWMFVSLLLLLPDTTPLLGQPNRWMTLVLGSLYCWAWLAVYFGARALAMNAYGRSHRA
jgi:hypothetical protein